MSFSDCWLRHDFKWKCKNSRRGLGTTGFSWNWYSSYELMRVQLFAVWSTWSHHEARWRTNGKKAREMLFDDTNSMNDMISTNCQIHKTSNITKTRSEGGMSHLSPDTTVGRNANNQRLSNFQTMDSSFWFNFLSSFSLFHWLSLKSLFWTLSDVFSDNSKALVLSLSVAIDLSIRIDIFPVELRTLVLVLIGALCLASDLFFDPEYK